jgi:DNA-binding GntR family transcriptional regulator
MPKSSATSRRPAPARDATTPAPSIREITERTSAQQGQRLTPLAHKAYREIKQMVLENKLHGGEYVLEEDLAEAVGMSRTPLREGLVQLQNEGLVAIVPRRGVRIVPLTVQDMKEVYDILQSLESQAASTLAARADREDYLVELRALVAQMN